MFKYSDVLPINDIYSTLRSKGGGYRRSVVPPFICIMYIRKCFIIDCAV